MVTHQHRDESTVLLQITLTKDELKSKIDADLKNIRQRAPIDGFRKGQIPASLVRKRYGNSVFADIFQKKVGEQMNEYLKDNLRNIVGLPIPTAESKPPSLNVEDIKDTYILEYEALVIPEMDIVGLNRTDTYPRWVAADIEERVEETLADILKNAKGQIEVEDSIELKDIVQLSAHELSEAQGEILEEGHEVLINVMPDVVQDEALKALLLSSKKGDTLRFNARTLEALNEQQYRKYLLRLEEDDAKVVGDHFEAEIVSVKRMKEGHADEAYYMRSFGNEVKDEAGARDYIRQNLKNAYDSLSDRLLYSKIRAGLLERNPVAIPDALFKRILLLTNDNISERDVEEQYSEMREKLCWNIIEENLSRLFPLGVTREELFNVLVEQAEKNMGIQLGREFWESMEERLMSDEKRVQEAARKLAFDKLLYGVLFPNVLIEEVPVRVEELKQAFENRYNDSKPAEEAKEEGAVPVETPAVS